MLKNVFIILAIVVTAHQACAELPEHTVTRRTDTIVIDGVLDDADWASAPSIDGFEFYEDTYTGPRQHTEVKLVWDDEFLYVAYLVTDTRIWGDVHTTNEKTYTDDCVEIFWIPNNVAMRPHYMFEMNYMGNLLSVMNDGKNSIHLRESRIMPPHIAQRVNGTPNDNSDTDEGWVLEIAIRFADYPRMITKPHPEPGDIWRVGFNRLDRMSDDSDDTATNMFSAWNRAKNFYADESFGRLIFSDRPAR